MANLDFRKSLIFGIWKCRITTNSNKTKLSRKANERILSTSTQCPQMVCLQNSTIITSAKTCHGVTTQGHTWLVCHTMGDCFHCKTNNQSLHNFSGKFRKIVIFGFFSPLPKNTRSTVLLVHNMLFGLDLQIAFCISCLVKYSLQGPLKDVLVTYSIF